MVSFKARGLVYLGARDYFREYVPGGLAAVRSELPDDLAEFWDQGFIATVMYDALPIVPLSQVAARLSGLSHTEFVRRNAAWLAERDLRGVYKMLLNVMTCESVALRLPKIAVRYFDFGVAHAKMQGKGLCLAQQRGIPQSMASWFIACVQGFVPVALGIVGAKGTRVKLVSALPDGGAAASTVTLSFEFTWH